MSDLAGYLTVGINLGSATAEQPRNSAAGHLINVATAPEELPPVLNQCRGSIAARSSPGIDIQLPDPYRLLVEQEVGCSVRQNETNRANFRSDRWWKSQGS